MNRLLDSRKLREGESLGVDYNHQAYIAVRKNGKAYVYINRCPHLGITLEFQPNVFLDTSGDYIQCSSHGALFELHNGHCIYGPCTGETLQNVAIIEFDGAIWLK